MVIMQEGGANPQLMRLVNLCMETSLVPKMLGIGKKLCLKKIGPVYAKYSQVPDQKYYAGCAISRNFLLLKINKLIQFFFVETKIS